MGQRAFRLARVCLAVAVLGGCGGGEGAAGFIEQYCEIHGPCCAVMGVPSNVQRCRAEFPPFTASRPYDPVAAQACLAAKRAQASQPGLCRGDFVEPVSCLRVFGSPGSKAALGAACTIDNDCATSPQGDVECNAAFPPTGEEIRKCQVVIRGVVGSTPCIRSVKGSATFEVGNPADVSPRGYACDLSEGLGCDRSSMACVALAAVGQPCNGVLACVVEAYCDSTSGTCIAHQAVGAPCSGRAVECEDAAYCRAATTCVAIHATGTACVEGAECTSGICTNSICASINSSFSLRFVCDGP